MMSQPFASLEIFSVVIFGPVIFDYSRLFSIWYGVAGLVMEMQGSRMTHGDADLLVVVCNGLLM